MNRYYMFNKPTGCVCATRDENDKTVMDYFNECDTSQLRIAGRLDKDTEGLLFVTNDTKWLTYITNPINHIEKKYFFWSFGRFSEEDIKRIEQGMSLIGMDGRCTSPAKLMVTGESIFKEQRHLVSGKNREKLLKNRDEHPVSCGYITVTEGKKHEVRRLIKAVGGCVFYLKRVSMAGIELDISLEPGEYKEINIDYE